MIKYAINVTFFYSVVQLGFFLKYKKVKDNFTHGANTKIHGKESFLKRGNAVLGVVSLQNIDSVTTMAVSFTRSLTI